MAYTPSPDDIARFSSFVGAADDRGCRHWMGAKNGQGYGVISIGGRRWLAHRFAFGAAKGFDALKPNAHICHACDVRDCVAPDHLWVGTAGENAADCTRKGRRARGEAYPNAKLTADAVREIRASGATVKDAALIGAFMAKFGVGYTTVYHVLTGQSWKHVK